MRYELSVQLNETAGASCKYDFVIASEFALTVCQINRMSLKILHSNEYFCLAMKRNLRVSRGYEEMTSLREVMQALKAAGMRALSGRKQPDMTYYDEF